MARKGILPDLAPASASNERGLEESRSFTLSPEARAPGRALQEAHVPPDRRQAHRQGRIAAQGFAGNGPGREERVVQAMRDERRYPDSAKVACAAAHLVVMIGAIESVQRSRGDLVEPPKRACLEGPAEDRIGSPV